MPDRREFLVGGLAAGALATSEYLRPRTTVRLMPAGKLEAFIPRSFDGWHEYALGNIIAPATPNSLADRLYSATVARTYLPIAADRPPVMLLVAYGGEQSDLLQLHRPEACYPAVGAPIVDHRYGSVLLGSGHVPATYLSAQNDNIVEDIVYFTRLGEALPVNAGEQRRDRLKQAMHGVIGDGVLVRASCMRAFGQPEWPYLAGFLNTLLLTFPPAVLRGFVGTRLAAGVSQAGRA